MSSYHDILGIPKGAGKEQVKRAFRKKAMQYHPDKNSSSDAQDMFIKINEAYEALMEERTMPKQRLRTTRTRSEMHEEIRRKAKEQAEYYAKMRYREFVNESKAFRKTIWFWPARILVYVIYLALLTFAGVCMFGIYMGASRYGIFGGVVFGVCFLPLILVLIVKAREFKSELEPFFKDYN